MKQPLSVTLVAMTALGLVTSDAMAFGCEVLTVETTTDSTLIITGEDLMSRYRPPQVWFGGIEVEVLSEPAPTPMQIVVDVASVIEGLSAPKDFLLKIKRSYYDFSCPSRMVTVVPSTFACTILGLEEVSWWLDFDNDSWGDPLISTQSCTQPLGYVDNNLDCDDNDPQVLGNTDWVADNDGDLFGTSTVVATGCGPFPNAVPDNGPMDCNDGNDSIYPGAAEICGDGVDQDCNGSDQTCP